MDWQERIDKYVRKTGFPKSLFIGDDGRAIRVWMLGNNYKIRSGYHGGFPANFSGADQGAVPRQISRVHLFSGKVDLSSLGRSICRSCPAARSMFARTSIPRTSMTARRWKRCRSKITIWFCATRPTRARTPNAMARPWCGEKKVLRALERSGRATSFGWIRFCRCGAGTVSRWRRSLESGKARTTGSGSCRFFAGRRDYSVP